MIVGLLAFESDIVLLLYTPFTPFRVSVSISVPFGGEDAAISAGDGASTCGPHIDDSSAGHGDHHQWQVCLDQLLHRVYEDLL